MSARRHALDVFDSRSPMGIRLAKRIFDVFFSLVAIAHALAGHGWCRIA